MKTRANLSGQSTRKNKFNSKVKETITFTKNLLFLTKKIFML